MQEPLSRANKAAWETKAYDAWVSYYGHPEELAVQLKETGAHHLRYWLKYTGNPTGRRVLNMLGSHGRKAISLALLGANVTVVDISEENRRYALQTAEAAGVDIRYICSDVLSIPNEEELGEFDFVLMEFGVLHYFADLRDVFAVVRRRLKAGGRLLLTDFHPFFRASQPEGDYFDAGVKEGEVAFAKLLPEEERGELNKVRVRGWMVGDIIGAVAEAGLYVRTFEELPCKSNPRLPEFYTLVADWVDAGLAPLFP
ncbi:class I SAM-dependent methyltransferase [Paenibacillus soyae]|uniref:Class I SAM-dependent methyltransferase n=1 Tax=Paenibacillus soyae TaxID=2969249 RepID=A0A9X2MYL1_9BACL|nr:class I SAM-dependent methyltransferase [Paenibacillus soyae]MCR2805872.1 class I SAM-dependent methyltransferase [Paenibacillus soyae]